MNCISARSTPQVLSIKDERTLKKKRKKFLLIRLCNSSASSLFEIFSFLIPLPEVDISCKAKGSDHASEGDFLSKNL